LRTGAAHTRGISSAVRQRNRLSRKQWRHDEALSAMTAEAGDLLPNISEAEMAMFDNNRGRCEPANLTNR
jgi:hypothetical protein